LQWPILADKTYPKKCRELPAIATSQERRTEMMKPKPHRIFAWALLLVLGTAPLALAEYKPPKDQKPPKETGSTARLYLQAPANGLGLTVRPKV